MVVIKECFPSRTEFIADYLAKRRQQLEILQQRKFSVSFLPRPEEKITPTEPISDIYRTGKPLCELDEKDIKTPLIFPFEGNEEPRYVKNFKIFIQQTHQHLNQVLANNQRIDDVHDIVTEIQKPVSFNRAIDENVLKFGQPELTVVAEETYPKQSRRVTSDMNLSEEKHTDEKSSGCDEDNVHTNDSRPKLNSCRSSGNSSFRSRSSRSSRSEASVKQSSKNISVAKSKISRTQGDTIKKPILIAGKNEKPPPGARKAIEPLSSYRSERSQTTRSTTTQPSKKLITGNLTKRITPNDSSRFERSTANWANKKMVSVPVSVINLQF